jgi:tripartite-type tricarboxylate transporter receptor subunit TctC
MLRAILLALVIALTNTSVAQAQDYPNKPVRFIVGAAAGSNTDILARLFAAEYQKALKQSFVVEDKPGAGGDIGTEEVVRSVPDGYTLLFDSASIMFGNKWLYPRKFDQDKDLISIIDIPGPPMVLLVGPELKGKTLKEIIAMAKAAPASWALGIATTWESIGYGLFCEATGIEFQLTRYKSAQQGFVELAKGDLKLAFSAVAAAQSMMSSGQLTPVAVTSPDRTGVIPDVPTMRELGVDMEITGWNGISGPRGTPKNVVELLNRVGNEILQNPDFQQKLLDTGVDLKNVKRRTPEDMDRAIQDGGDDWGRMIKRFGFKN